MPTYEYECKRCGSRFEVFQKITDRPKSRCPSCRGGVRRLLSGGAGLLFKGSGFYTTDYRSESYKSAAKSDRAPAASSSDSKESAGKTGGSAPAGGAGGAEKKKSRKAG